MSAKHIHIIRPGIQTVVLGPPSYSLIEYGVPIGGPMDARSANLCNTLVGNSITSGIMEMTLIGPEIRFDEFAQIAICGAEMAPLLNGEPCAMNRRLTIQAGSILKFGKATRGCRAYLAIAGGIEMIMKEFLPDRLNKNETISLSKDETRSANSVPAHDFSSNEFQVEEGPDFRIFNRKSMEKLFEPELTIGPQSNRMAYLLKSNLPINYTEFDSTAVIPGTIQLTPSGQLNILMRDCQTTGGYPRIGILDDFGISRLAQKKPGENISLIWSV